MINFNIPKHSKPVVAETSKPLSSHRIQDIMVNQFDTNVSIPKHNSVKHLTPQDPESVDGTAPHTSTSKNVSDSGHRGSLTKMINSYIDARDHSHFMVSFHVGIAGSQGGGAPERE